MGGRERGSEVYDDYMRQTVLCAWRRHRSAVLASRCGIHYCTEAVMDAWWYGPVPDRWLEIPFVVASSEAWACFWFSFSPVVVREN